MRTPHDRLLRSTLSVPAEAAAFFGRFLPEAVRRHADLSGLRLVHGSFIDDRLKEQITDLLFEMRIAGAPGLIHMLMEHHSSPPEMLPYRMIGGTRRVWETWREHHPEAHVLPPVLAVLVYHGARPWSGPPRLSGIIAVPEDFRDDLGPWLPEQRTFVIDLTPVPDEVFHALAVAGAVRAALTMLFLKHGRAPGFLDRIGSWSRLISELVRAPDGWSALRKLVSYVVRLRADIPVVEVARVFGRISGPKAEEFPMNLAERIARERKEEFEAKGRVEGRIEALKEALLRILASRFGQPGAETRNRVLAADAAELEAWFDRALTATELRRVFED